jgi:histidinol-phosphate aminotransferase
MFDFKKIVKPHLWALRPYISARDEFAGELKAMLDANENPYGSIGLASDFSRYPDSHHRALKRAISEFKNIPTEHIFVGNGSDEAIDLLMRTFCEEDANVIFCPPTFEIYQISATINNVKTKEVPLTEDYGLDTDGILKAIDDKTRIVIICSPNNPTGNLYPVAEIRKIATVLQNGIVLVDEAYIDFAESESCLNIMSEYPNVVVSQSFSKAWGIAGLRCGLLFASAELTEFLHRLKPPYNVNSYAQSQAIEALKHRKKYEELLRLIISGREFLEKNVANFSFVEKVYPSKANFIFIKVTSSLDLYNFLLSKGIIVRKLGHQLCKNTLRITVGTPKENDLILSAFAEFEQNFAKMRQSIAQTPKM